MQSNFKQLLAFTLVILVMSGLGWLLLKYFYPSEKLITPVNIADSPEQPTDNQASQNKETPDETILNYKSNLTLEAIKNTTYLLFGDIEAKFENGEFQRGTFDPRSENYAYSNIEKYLFGDINGDGSGDAIVVTSTVFGLTPFYELYAVINNHGLAKSIPLSLPNDLGQIAGYHNISIQDGKIILDMAIAEPADSPCCPSGRKTRTFVFADNKLVVYVNKINWKKYKSEEFGFEFAYPEAVPLTVRPIVENGRDVYGTIFTSVSLPFVNNYNTWNKKSFNVYVNAGACPYRNNATVVTRNDIEFHEYAPSVATTSSAVNNLALKELMAYRGKHCFILISKIEGPGPLSPQFPKSTDPKSPDNLENFLAFEFVILEQVLDTFRFL